jgi:hypothetical protein
VWYSGGVFEYKVPREILESIRYETQKNEKYVILARKSEDYMLRLKQVGDF